MTVSGVLGLHTVLLFKLELVAFRCMYPESLWILVILLVDFQSLCPINSKVAPRGFDCGFLAT